MRVIVSVSHMCQNLKTMGSPRDPTLSSVLSIVDHFVQGSRTRDHHQNSPLKYCYVKYSYMGVKTAILGEHVIISYLL